MILTLMGMSGVGKTVCATKLAAHGFQVIDCDALLAAKLQAIVADSGMTLEEIGRWMGFPYEADFRRREALYLACEQNVLHDVLAQTTASAATETNCVIDTGGSIIYAEPALLQSLRQHSTVIYLRVPDVLHPQLLSSYLLCPRPLIWNGLFSQTPDEQLQDAFRRCYTQLICHRERLYEQYSHLVLEYSDYRQPGFSAEDLLRAAEQLRAAEPVEWSRVDV
ncbi:MAG TPA: shikimate kinase [Herpetosiphonaceae bacterium]